VPSSIHILVSSSDDENDDENPPPPTHLPLDESIEHELELAPLPPRWVCSAQEAIKVSSISTKIQFNISA
jgi:hypothetical protein